MRQRQDADPSGKKAERSLRDRVLGSKLGRRATTGLVILSAAGAGNIATGEASMGVKSDGPTPSSLDINANPTLPEQLQMGSERAITEGFEGSTVMLPPTGQLGLGETARQLDPVEEKSYALAIPVNTSEYFAARLVSPPVNGAPTQANPGDPVNNPF